jgi:hypothetical protein
MNRPPQNAPVLGTNRVCEHLRHTPSASVIYSIEHISSRS